MLAATRFGRISAAHPGVAADSLPGTPPDTVAGYHPPVATRLVFGQNVRVNPEQSTLRTTFSWSDTAVVLDPVALILVSTAWSARTPISCSPTPRGTGRER